MTEFDAQEILKRLKALEEENAQLRMAKAPNVVKPLIVTESEYKGHPTLIFEGPCKPFTIGYKKLCILKQGWPQIELFLDRHAKDKGIHSMNDDDDKI